jgi:type IV secretion system protein VirB6
MTHLLAATFPLLAQALPAANPGFNWLYQFSQNLSNLTTQNGGALTQLGMTELSFVSLMVLVRMVMDMQLSTMALTFHRQPIHIGELVQFLVRLMFCMLLESYWINPLPGAGFGFNHLFSWFAQEIVQVLDQNSLSTLQQLIATAGQNTTLPTFTAPLKIFCYLIAQLDLAIISGILFLVNASGYIFYGVCALFGPVFIPLYMTKTFRGKFLHFVDVLLSFAMIRAVATAFVFVWSGFLNAFIQQTFNNNYSLENWIANLIPVTAVLLAFDLNMLFVPAITQTIFGGGAGLASRAEERVMQLAALAGSGA